MFPSTEAFKKRRIASQECKTVCIDSNKFIYYCKRGDTNTPNEWVEGLILLSGLSNVRSRVEKEFGAHPS